ncbi:MAG: tyrosine-type recombinase/integrase [Chloroflexi bacterium]|nr:tyrosine-type recombinase/integrase [Chloroflexota bacterium]
MRERHFVPVLPPATFCVPASADLRTSLQDFYLSRQALRRSPATLEHYRYTAGEFVSWLESQGVLHPSEVRAAHPRAWLASVSGRKVKDTPLHAKARGAKTLLRFWYSEGYLPSPVDLQLPRLDQKKLPSLTVDELQLVIKACHSLRDRALVLLLADSGLRRGEALARNWGEVDFSTGAVFVRRGKGGKARTAAIGATTRRAILSYRRSLARAEANSPMFQTRYGSRLRPGGLRSIFPRLSYRAGFLVTPHILRRTFALHLLRQGMDLITLQRLMGHSDPAMTARYVRLLIDDLLAEHADHGLDAWLRS